MKIVQIIPSLERGGAERLCIDISNELLKRGNRVLIVNFNNINEYQELTKNINIISTSVSKKISFLKPNKINIKELQDVINEFNPDVIHTHLYEAELIAYELKTNAKFISHIHSNRKELYKQNIIALTSKDKMVNWFERKHYLKLFHNKNVELIAISKDCQEFAINELGVKTKKVHYLVNCIDYSLFKGEPKKSPSNKLYLINIGRFVPNKAQDFLIDVAVILKRKKIDFNLTFLGDGVEMKNIKELAKIKKVDQLIQFKGIASKPENYLKESSIYIHSSKKEAFGLVLIEAMAAGLPVVSTDGIGNRDIIKEGKNGFIIYERDCKLFANKIIELLNSPEKYESISKYAIRFAEKYDIKTYINELIKYY